MSLNKIFRLNNKVAIVTGGAGHLGRAMSEALAECGAGVIVAGKNLGKCIKLAKDIKDKYKVRSLGVKMDISSKESIAKAMRLIYKNMGSIDILVNNAVYCKMGLPEKMTEDAWGYGIDGTLSSVFRCIREAIPYMRRGKYGNIINISSMYGIISPDFGIYEGDRGLFSPPNYGSAKAGVIQLTRYYGVFLAKYNIRVNCISPGAFPSSAVLKNGRFIKSLIKKIPMGRLGCPGDLKGVMAFLASDASSYMTGQNIVVDGGWTAC